MHDCRILVIDDDEFMLAVAQQLFRSLGFSNINILAQPRRITEDAALLDHDIIFCDLLMPDFDGVEVLRYLSDSAYPGGVVLVSGVDERVLASAHQLARDRKLNVVGTLEKPFSVRNISRLFEASPDLIKSGKNLGTGNSGPVAGTDPGQERDPLGPHELAHALDRQELVAFYQPKVSIHTGEFLGVEALARWRHPELGLIPPFAFIGLAEEHGLIDQVAEQIIGQAFMQGGRWIDQGLDLKIAINLSIKNLNRLDFPDRSVVLAREARLPLASLIFEITESSIVTDRVTVMEILTRLRLKGISLSIDDFGTGYSSMEQLMHIPFLELKIDRSFVGRAGQETAARAILDSSVGLARRLGMTVVAEGVETLEDWYLVKNAGCDIAQGYFVSPPLPGDAIMPWSRQWERIRGSLCPPAMPTGPADKR